MSGLASVSYDNDPVVRDEDRAAAWGDVLVALRCDREIVAIQRQDCAERSLHRRRMQPEDVEPVALIVKLQYVPRKAGILDRHDFGDGRSRYEAAPEAHHDHLIDVETGPGDRICRSRTGSAAKVRSRNSSAIASSITAWSFMASHRPPALKAHRGLAADWPAAGSILAVAAGCAFHCMTLAVLVMRSAAAIVPARRSMDCWRASLSNGSDAAQSRCPIHRQSCVLASIFWSSRGAAGRPLSPRRTWQSCQCSAGSPGLNRLVYVQREARLNVASQVGGDERGAGG